MKRPIIKWWISQAIDQSVELKGWLQSQIERDSELQQFEHDARRLACDLRDEANVWLTKGGNSREHVIMPGRNLVLPSWAWCLSAAALVLLIVRLVLPSASGHRHPSTIASRDAAALLAFLDASEAVIRPWQQVPCRAASWPEPTWAVHGVTQATVAVERQTERVWGDLKSSLDTEKQRAVSDLKAASHFLSRTLPSSLARLIVP